ncbi:hypothetical protein BN1184_AA_01040 [Pantoea ananatis]|nr:hypothetical protein BN1184_AA_01040 [Pantoea ananatis]
MCPVLNNRGTLPIDRAICETSSVEHVYIQALQPVTGTGGAIRESISSRQALWRHSPNARFKMSR